MAHTMKKVTAGEYKANVEGHEITISRWEGVDEWSLRVDGEWAAYFPTKKMALEHIDWALSQ